MKDNYSAEEFRKLLNNGTIKISKKRLKMDSNELLLKDKQSTTIDNKVSKIKNKKVINPIIEYSDYEVLSFEINSILPTLNKYINAERTNKYIASSMKKKATEICKISSSILYGFSNPEILHDIKVHYIVPNNKIDSDNLYFGIKFILDGMVKAEILKDDSRKYIRNIENSIETIKDKYLIQVSLLKVKK